MRGGATGDRLLPHDGSRGDSVLAWLQTDSKNDVAEVLHIAPATVRTHLQRVRTKYAAVGRPAPTKSALLARAVEDGIVGLSELAVLGSRPPIG